MKNLSIGLIILIILTCVISTFAQTGESPIKIFGYFQNELGLEYSLKEKKNENSFTMQQLNLFFQKDLARNWTSFISFEIINNYSSSRQWGAFNLEEAWARYRLNMKFNIKLGLQTPIFNNLNEIKNRTPLLPYIIRPLAYETSFGENIEIEELVPARTFVQAYGFIPCKNTKFDYAVYLGNSPNINRWGDDDQSGMDSSATFLIGGRIGIRHNELKLGFSFTHDYTDRFVGYEFYFDKPQFSFKNTARTRFGIDFSYTFKNFSIENEYILVTYDDDIDDINYTKKFYYSTLGYNITDKLFVYGSYWVTEENYIFALEDNKFEIGDVEVTVPNMGISYNLNDRITFKGHIARANIGADNPIILKNVEYNFYCIAISIFF